MKRPPKESFPPAPEWYHPEGLTPEQWLAQEFEFEYCEMCGGDETNHIASPGPFGLPFAWCTLPEVTE